ncbi:unnamed protein product, partial [Ilex paraguariensis]
EWYSLVVRKSLGGIGEKVTSRGDTLWTRQMDDDGRSGAKNKEEKLQAKLETRRLCFIISSPPDCSG